MATNAPNANRRQPDCFEKKKTDKKVNQRNELKEFKIQIFAYLMSFFFSV